MKIIYPNVVDDLSAISASSEVASLPVTNLQEQKRSRIWRTTDASDAWVKGNWNGNQTIDSFAYVRHNIGASGTIRLRLYSAINQGGTLLYDSGVLAQGTSLGWGLFPWGTSPWGGSSVFAHWAYRFAQLFFTAVTTARSFRLDISDAGNTDGYFEGARLFLGEAIDLDDNAGSGSGWWWVDNSRQRRTRGGSLGTDRRQKFRRWEVKLGVLDADELAALLELAQRAGLNDDMFIALRDGVGGEAERDAAGQVQIVDMPKTTTLQDASHLSETSIVFEEV